MASSQFAAGMQGAFGVAKGAPTTFGLAAAALAAALQHAPPNDSDNRVDILSDHGNALRRENLMKRENDKDDLDMFIKTVLTKEYDAGQSPATQDKGGEDRKKGNSEEEERREQNEGEGGGGDREEEHNDDWGEKEGESGEWSEETLDAVKPVLTVLLQGRRLEEKGSPKQKGEQPQEDGAGSPKRKREQLQEEGASSPKKQKGDGEGDGAGDGTGDGTGDGAGDGAGDGTGDQAGDGTGDGTGDQAGDGTGDQAGDQAGDGTGDGAGDGTGDQAAGPAAAAAQPPDDDDPDPDGNNPQTEQQKKKKNEIIKRWETLAAALGVAMKAIEKAWAQFNEFIQKPMENAKERIWDAVERVYKAPTIFQGIQQLFGYTERYRQLCRWLNAGTITLVEAQLQQRLELQNMLLWQQHLQTAYTVAGVLPGDWGRELIDTVIEGAKAYCQTLDPTTSSSYILRNTMYKIAQGFITSLVAGTPLTFLGPHGSSILKPFAEKLTQGVQALLTKPYLLYSCISPPQSRAPDDPHPAPDPPQDPAPDPPHGPPPPPDPLHPTAARIAEHFVEGRWLQALADTILYALGSHERVTGMVPQQVTLLIKAALKITTPDRFIGRNIAEVFTIASQSITEQPYAEKSATAACALISLFCTAPAIAKHVPPRVMENVVIWLSAGVYADATGATVNLSHLVVLSKVLKNISLVMGPGIFSTIISTLPAAMDMAEEAARRGMYAVATGVFYTVYGPPKNPKMIHHLDPRDGMKWFAEHTPHKKTKKQQSLLYRAAKTLFWHVNPSTIVSIMWNAPAWSIPITVWILKRSVGGYTAMALDMAFPKS